MTSDPETELRIEEIEAYIELLRKLDSPGAQLRFSIDNQQVDEVLDSDLLKTLKATAYLLMYNFVEASVRAAVQSIFDELKAKHVSYDSVRSELRSVCLQNVRRIALPKETKKRLVASKSIARDLLTEPFEPDDLFSGNVDARRISELAASYGFSSKCKTPAARNGSDLHRVKDIRNELGHGIRTFRDVGKDISIPELVELKGQVVAYIRDILDNILEYVQNERYLAPH